MDAGWDPPPHRRPLKMGTAVKAEARPDIFEEG